MTLEQSVGAPTGIRRRPLRADAERNRQRILTAAAEVFAERGLDAGLDETIAWVRVNLGLFRVDQYTT